ncbi:GNAT family N-acetyltransferase [Paenibacillaceae bacterium WGS1546]|uniref:GNAT family N-acetyltransferase n=1 Tax=Cohnella sp. WGS1546 TaxID=3366810 RepID=UPI00372D7B1F
MSVTYRYGNLKDSIAVFARDPQISAHLLIWKLQNQEIILAIDEKAGLIGYLRLEYLWSKYPYIGLIVVQPDYRGRGIGANLLAFAQDHLKRKGLRDLYSSSQANESRPQEWHRKMGFRECGILNDINEGKVGEVFFVKSIE